MSPNSLDCLDVVQLHDCKEFIGCLTIETCDDQPDCPGDGFDITWFNATYSTEGKYNDGKYHARINLTSCGDQISPILGCCKNGTDNCTHGCPQQDLTLSFLSVIPDARPGLTSDDAQPDTNAISFYTLSPTSTPTVDASSGSAQATSTAQGSASSTSVSSTVTPAATGGQLALPTAQSVPKSNTAIAGGVAGGCVGLALLVGLLAICCRRRRSSKPRQHVDEARSPTWASGQVHPRQSDDAELDEMKQGPSPTTSPLHPSSPPPSPLLSPIPPPPIYSPYESLSNERDRSPDHLDPSAGSPYASYNLPSPESRPSPPPLNSRISQHSTSNYSDGPNVSPISSHYQHHPFDDSRGLETNVYSGVSSRELLQTHSEHS